MSKGTGAMKPRYDLTVALTYYLPYLSGLTETARNVAEGMAARGWRVAVLAAQHDPKLPRLERINGVDVHRAPIAARVHRAFLSPAYPVLARRLARQSRLLHLNVPMAEAGVVARLAGDTPIVTMVHIDLYLPPGLLGRIAVRASDATTRSAIRQADAVVAYSDDQAHASKFWPLIRQRRFVPIAAPCTDRRGGSPAYRQGSGLHIGFLGRIVEDKGIEYLVHAFQRIADPSARLLIAGNYKTVAGGSNVAQVRAAMAGDSRIQLLGELRGSQVDDFYASIDVFALPSVAESFGIVQAEAMMAGVPSVTTDLPGGRYPVTSTEFGRVVAPRDVPALEKAILELAETTPQWRAEKAAEARRRFSVDACLDAHQELFESLLRR